MKNQALPLVSIISVNYNQSEVSCEMLHSLSKITYPNIEVIMVDNASPDDNPEIIPQRFPYVKFIQSETNGGFAAGNNLGLQEAKGEFILFLNNDMEVDPEFLEPLVDFLIENPKTGVVSPKIKFHYKPTHLQYAGFTQIHPITGRNKALAYNIEDNSQFDKNSQTAYAHGAAMLVRASVIKEIGPMPEFYFLYYEEIDWCESIKKAGYNLYYIHKSVVFHKESVSTGKDSLLKTYYLNRNRLIYMRRHISGLTFLLALLYYFLLAFPKNALLYLIKYNFRFFNRYVNSIFWHFTHLKSMRYVQLQTQNS